MAGGEKCTEELKIRVTEGLREEIMRLAFAADRSPSEYVRWVLNLHVYGHSRTVQDKPSEARGTNGSSSGPRREPRHG